MLVGGKDCGKGLSIGIKKFNTAQYVQEASHDPFSEIRVLTYNNVFGIWQV